jgi:hypothetical protein
MSKLLREKYELMRESELFSEMKAVSSYKTDELTSKMWILPDGKPISLNQWHYRWLQSNPKTAMKYGLDMKKLPDEEQPVRIAALKNGFFRVNYERNTGSMTIEGLSSKFHKKIKDAIFVIAIDNLESIDRLKLNLLDNTVTKLVRSDEVTLFTYRNDDDKLSAVEDILR